MGWAVRREVGLCPGGRKRILAVGLVGGEERERGREGVASDGASGAYTRTHKIGAREAGAEGGRKSSVERKFMGRSAASAAARWAAAAGAWCV